MILCREKTMRPNRTYSPCLPQTAKISAEILRADTRDTRDTRRFLARHAVSFSISIPNSTLLIPNWTRHPDHLGSASWITNIYGRTIQHLHYLPWGENFVDQRTSSFSSMYTFSAKEKDTETGYSYFGSRYYSSDLSIWLSVDPMSDKYPSMSPYVYCANNPVKLVDPNGEEFRNPDDPPKNKSQNNSKSSTTTTAGTSQTYNGLFFNASYSTSQTKGDQKLLNVDKKTSTELKTGETTSTTSYQFGKPKLNASAEVGVSTSGSTTGKLNTTVGGVQAGVGFTTTQKIDNSQVSVSLGYSNGEKSSSVAVSIKPLRVAAVVATVFIAAASTAIIHVPIVIPF